MQNLSQPFQIKQSFVKTMKLFMNSSGASPRRLFTILKKVTNSSLEVSRSNTASTNSLKSTVPELSLSAAVKNFLNSDLLKL